MTVCDRLARLSTNTCGGTVNTRVRLGIASRMMAGGVARQAHREGERVEEREGSGLTEPPRFAVLWVVTALPLTSPLVPVTTLNPLRLAELRDVPLLPAPLEFAVANPPPA